MPKLVVGKTQDPVEALGVDLSRAGRAVGGWFAQRWKTIAVLAVAALPCVATPAAISGRERVTNAAVGAAFGDGTRAAESLGPADPLARSRARPPAPLAPASAPRSPAVDSSADLDALTLLRSSPTVGRHLDELIANGWTIRWGLPGRGSYCDYGATQIVLDPSGPSVLHRTQTLSHEVGHAYTGEPAYVDPANLTRQQYVEENAWAHLRSEGEATLENVVAEAEIRRATGDEIGVAGKNASAYRSIALDPALTHEQKVQRIADLFARGERPSTNRHVTNYLEHFSQFYGRRWDATRAAPLPVKGATPPSSTPGIAGAFSGM